MKEKIEIDSITKWVGKYLFNTKEDVVTGELAGCETLRMDYPLVSL
jgi:hypothetical protein